MNFHFFVKFKLNHAKAPPDMNLNAKTFAFVTFSIFTGNSSLLTAF